jgi:L-lactate dehydrogenase complex protein LldG
MTARENILARIRAAQGRTGPPDAAERAAVAARIGAHPPGPRPQSAWEPVARFAECAVKLSTTVDSVAAFADAPRTIARYLEQNNLPKRAVCWPELFELEWQAAGINIESRPAEGADLVGITGAFCAIAETGTLMLLSGARTPATTSLLPETHIAVVRAERIVRGMEDAWKLLRDERGAPADGGAVPASVAGRCDPGAGAGAREISTGVGRVSAVTSPLGGVPAPRSIAPFMPRAVNFVSGPSRTADIEQTLVLGAHGPYRVHIVLVKNG